MPHSKAKYSKEFLLAQLKAKGKLLGRRPKYRDLDSSTAAFQTYQRYFGSWGKALQEAGFQSCPLPRKSRGDIWAKASEIKMEYEKGSTIAEIAGKYLCSTKLIERCLQEQHVKFRFARARYPLKGEQHPKWKGGRIKSNGYVKVYQPDYRGRGKEGNYVAEHIFIWQQYHGKELPKGWIVHHLNSIRDDNRPENLVALPIRRHNETHLGASVALSEQRIKRIRQLEAEIVQLCKALENHQAIFYIPAS